MIHLLLVRHGRTDWNAQMRYQGQTDPPLNDTGRLQVEALSRRLAREEIDALYTSDLRRARETAEAIATPHGLPVRVEPRLREMYFGMWEGLTYPEIQERYPQDLAAWEADPMATSPTAGEGLTQVSARAASVLEEVAGKHQEQVVLFVGHSGILRVLLCLALGLSPALNWKFRMDTASFSELKLYPEGAVLVTLNNISHLDL